MVGLAIALIVVGLIFLFIFPWVGIPIGLVGVLLFVLYLAGFLRRTAEPGP